MTNLPGAGDDVKDRVQEYWNRRAESYDSDGISSITGDDQREAWRSVLSEYTGGNEQRALDVGCGTGEISLVLAELGHDVTGIDLSREMLDRARTKAQQAGMSIEFQTGDAEDVPLSDDAYDFVTARHLIWTLPDPSGAIQEWCRVVRPGGRIILIEGFSEFDEPWDGYQEIHEELPLYDGRPPEELVAFISHQGFENIEHESLPDPVLWGDDPDQEMYLLTFPVPE